MIDSGRLYEYLHQKGIRFFSGVPDSLMKDFLQYLQEHAVPGEHIITANEGLAIALASGYHFRTGRIPLVYLQNSGLGNIINPLSSLVDPEMYAVPMLLLIGWRGMPGKKDEPQHQKMGRITIPMLEAMEVPYYLLSDQEEELFDTIQTAITKAADCSCPVALLVPGDIFAPYTAMNAEKDFFSLGREEVIREIINRFSGTEKLICTTGKTGREFYELNKEAGNKFTNYLLCAGAMGHAGHIALGVSADHTSTILLDGDGALLMHLGGLTTIAPFAAGDFFHIVLNNGQHESVGGQPTAGFSADLCGLAAAAGYSNTVLIQTDEELKQWLATAPSQKGLHFVEIRIKQGSRQNLGRPAGVPVEWKNDFMNAIQKKPD
jgi:phosphonopyruvate decarboxylase